MKDTHTPIRSIRVPDEIWQHAQEQARIEGTTVSARVVDSLRRWRGKPQ